MFKFIDFLLYPLVVPNITYIKKLIRKNIPRQEVTYYFTRNSLYLKKINCTVSKEKNFFLLEGIDLLYDLVNLCNASITIDDNHKVYIKIHGLEFSLNSWEEINIFHEIFVQGVYNIILPDEFVFIDIGMNVGITSLFFALKENVQRIYAFEPFKETFACGQNNFNRNTIQSEKIVPQNYGIGDRDENVVAEYISEIKGSVGIYGIPPRLLTGKLKENIIKETISIKRVDDVLMGIRKDHPGEKLIAKIDCEGAEYEIINLLDKKKLLRELYIVMIEWHNHGPTSLCDILIKNKFNCLSLGTYRKDVGMIYAFQQ